MSLVQFSLSVVSDSLRPHEPQHTRSPCPSPTPGVYTNSCPSCQWCHPTISSSVISFSSHLQSLRASGSFQMSQFFASGRQRIGVSALASVLPMNIQDWFPLGLTNWIPLWSNGFSGVFSNTTVREASISVLSLLKDPTVISIHYYWKKHSFDYTDLCWQSDVSASAYAIKVCHPFSSKEQTSFNFMAAVTICSDFAAQENTCISWLMPSLSQLHGTPNPSF